MRFKTIALLTHVGLFVLPNMLAAGQGQANSPAGNLAAGRRLFENHCALCHGIDGKGGRGPSLNRARLRRAPSDVALKTLISDGIPSEMPDGWYLDEADVSNLAAYVRSLGKIPTEPLTGDPARGVRVYSANGCANCHVLSGRGTAYGPELSDIGERRSAQYILDTILNPAATLIKSGSAGAWTLSSGTTPDFMFVEAIIKSGGKIQGVRVNEDSFSIQIKNAEGKYYSLRKQDLKELRKLRGETPMPPFAGVLNATELQDLAAYLASQTGTP